MSENNAPPMSRVKTNRLGLEVSEYRGVKTTLCAGCGHNSISERLVEAFFELGIEPHRVAKFSGIGCSSKSPNYFLGKSYALNAVHGRMPSIATGAILANRNLVALGVSGDGDTASIGLGQFIHLLRRNVPMVYIIEDNGVYGLTKGQFSATADKGSLSKGGVANELPPIDTCLLGIEMGASFVARSFSGDKKQLLAILKAALCHRGTALVDVISPCVTFNDHEGSTKSYEYLKEHRTPLMEVEFQPDDARVEVGYDPGTGIEIPLPGGGLLRLKKLPLDYQPCNQMAAASMLKQASERGEVLTGIFYLDPHAPSFTDRLNLVDEPLAELGEDRLRPSREVLLEILEELR